MFTMLPMSALKNKSKQKNPTLGRHSPPPHCGVRDRLHAMEEVNAGLIKSHHPHSDCRGLPVSHWRPPHVSVDSEGVRKQIFGKVLPAMAVS